MHPAREPVASAGRPPRLLEVAQAGPAEAPVAAETAPESPAEERSQAWLDAQCSMIAGVASGVVMRRTGGRAPELLARWPKDGEGSLAALAEAAAQAAAERTVVVRTGTDPAGAVASPIREHVERVRAAGSSAASVVASPIRAAAGEVVVVALEVPGSTRAQHQAIVQLLQWGATWYQLLENQAPVPDSGGGRLTTVVELLASALEHASFQAAATATVTELAARLGCSRVSLGLLHGKHVEVCAISHSARIDTRSNLVREIGAAMDEAIDQGATVACPPAPDAPPLVAFAQEVLARRGDGASVCTTPLYCGERAVGALTLERDGVRGFDKADVETCETLGALIGPIVELQHERDRWVIAKLWDACADGARRLLGRGHVALKLYAGVAVAVIAFLAVATGDYRVTAGARLEGSVKRVVTAPRDGYVASAEVRAGDTVEAGQALATLDDRELRLEALRWRGQREQLEKEHRAAVSGHDRSRAAIARAQMKQTDAQLELVREQLARSRLVAPFGGVVVSGDLSQELGAPVEHGQVLFEIAPLEAYRVMLEVDERDIGEVVAGQRGELTLTGLPGSALAFEVVRVVPVSAPRDGRNVFEVEAALTDAAPVLRPGMEGVGKVHVDRRRLVWIWTHALVDWLRLSLWTWVS